MGKKMKIVGILVVCMLVTVSLTTVVSSNKSEDTKESPLYKIRTKQAIKEKIGNLLHQIKTKFFGDRVFFNVFDWFRTSMSSQLKGEKDPGWIITSKLD